MGQRCLTPLSNIAALTPLSDPIGPTTISSFAARVVAWQRRHGRHDLPWQDTRDAYRIWLSEIMLQQTQVATVLPYFTRFIGEFPDVVTLARAPLARVLELWSGLGYYRRAHHLHAAACEVVADHEGRFPSDAATLATLPGIGRSTAAAIAAFASSERGAILDGNVKRVLARHRGIAGSPGASAVEAQFWRAAQTLLPDEAGDIGGYTQGMMDLGATICTRGAPRCERCPVREDCVARRKGRIADLPARRPRRILPQREVIVLLLERGGRVLLERRPPVGVWGGLWSFPELAVDADVLAHVADRFGVRAQRIERMAPMTQVFTHFLLTMHPVRVPVGHALALAQAPAVDWFPIGTAVPAAVPAAVRRLLASLPLEERGKLPP